MGIPSYYKKLCDSIPGLLSKVRKGPQPTHLWVDFNCMVYHCLRRPGATPYTSHEHKYGWEAQLIQDTCKYLKKIVSIVNPSKQVFVGVDGVVPMAKMRQQRLRRFKSHWVAAEEIRIGKSEAKPRWDTNAITPGTEFMERLGKALQEQRTEGIKWIVSTADEPGEGEHKAMNALRNCNDRESHVVYGLDADLIILSLLQPVQNMWLFREAVECGEVQYTDSEEEYRYFSIHKLKEYLNKGQDDTYLLDYCMAMCFVGNDFLPHSFTMKLKDGGHDGLLNMLREVRSSCGTFIDPVEQSWRIESVRQCIEWLAKQETKAMKLHISKKLGARFQPTRGSTPTEHAVDEWNKMPLRMGDELALVKSMERSERELRVELLESWQSVYNERYLSISCEEDLDKCITEYMKGLDWVLKYYTGKPVDTEWYFPWYTTPLWCCMKEWLRNQTVLPKSTKPIGQTFVKPQEQLTMVLPLESWWLIRDKKLQQIPKFLPQMYPKSFELFTGGRKLTWECEAKLPIMTPQRLRYILSQLS